MYNLIDTICAICTPRGVGGIAGIRISGSDCWNIVKNFFSLPDGKSEFEHMHAMHGFIKDGGKIIDEVIVLPFKSPHSYTTEDVVEIYCHGGSQVASMILDLFLRSGARLAEAGEFTFRAFINGRIDLTEVEAINDIVHATSARSVYAATELITGSLKRKVDVFRDELFELITTIEGSIEFPQDVPPVSREVVALKLNDISQKLNELIETSKEGQLLREGIKVSILGAPNVGKSTLLNRLLENERAIVTDEPGTTRDVIEEKIMVSGWPVVFADTAGIRDLSFTGQPERLGIQKSEAVLKDSEVAILVVDLSKGLDEDTRRIVDLIGSKPKVVVGNKIDLIETNGHLLKNSVDVCISAKFGTNLEELKGLIIGKVNGLVQSSACRPQPVFYVNQRQKELLLQCLQSVEFASGVAGKDLPLDLIADELKKAVSKLDQMSGREINDEVIQNIFAEFCIGK